MEFSTKLEEVVEGRVSVDRLGDERWLGECVVRQGVAAARWEAKSEAKSELSDNLAGGGVLCGVEMGGGCGEGREAQSQGRSIAFKWVARCGLKGKRWLSGQ